MTTLLLIRHGESEWNRVGRIQGQVDTPLTAAGIEQARSIGGYLAQWLNGRTLRVYSSPLSRAYRTAAIIAEKIGYSSVDIKVDGRLNDFNQGDIAGIDDFNKIIHRIRIYIN